MTPIDDQSPFESALLAATRLLGALVAAAVLTGSCLSGLGWWVEGDGAADPAWERIPDGGVLLGEDLCGAFDGGCVDAGQDGTRAIEGAK